MMAWDPYRDKKNHAYAGILTTLFPEQTKTVPRIVVWSVIFLLDLILGISGAYHYGILSLDYPSKWMSLVVIVGIVAVFWLQGVLWGAFMKFLKKHSSPKAV